MKLKVEAWRKLYSEIDDAIAHSRSEGLPLSSIELTNAEWTEFEWAREHYKVAPSKFSNSRALMAQHSSTHYGSVVRVKIYKEGT